MTGNRIPLTESVHRDQVNVNRTKQKARESYHKCKRLGMFLAALAICASVGTMVIVTTQDFTNRMNVYWIVNGGAFVFLALSIAAMLLLTYAKRQKGLM